MRMAEIIKYIGAMNDCEPVFEDFFLICIMFLLMSVKLPLASLYPEVLGIINNLCQNHGIRRGI